MVKAGSVKNGIAAHAWKMQHPVDWVSARVWSLEPNMWKRKVLEAIQIKQTKNTSNLDHDLILNQIWSPLIG